MLVLTSVFSVSAAGLELQGDYYYPNVSGLNGVRYMALNGSDIDLKIGFMRGVFDSKLFNVYYLEDPNALEKVPTREADIPPYLDKDLIVSVMSVKEIFSTDDVLKLTGVKLTSEEYGVATQLAVSVAVAQNSQIYKLQDSSISHNGIKTVVDWMVATAKEQIRLKPTNQSALSFLWGSPTMTLDASEVVSTVEGSFNYYGPYYVKSDDLTLVAGPATAPTNYALVSSVDGNVIDSVCVNEPFYVRFDNQLISDIQIILEASPYSATIAEYGDAICLYRGLVRVQTQLTISNQSRVGTITYLKYDKNTRTVIPGTVLEILDTQGNVVGTMITDSNGVATSPALEVGEYVVREMKATSGYSLDTTEYEVSLSGNGAVVELTSTATSSNAICNFYVTDRATSSPVGGSVFEIVNEDGDVVKRIGVNDSGLCQNIAIPEGIYELRETVTNIGYQLIVEHLRFRVESGKETNIPVSKDKAYNKTIFEFKDSYGSPSGEVNFSLYGVEGNLIVSQLTNSYGELELTLPRGDYILVAGTTNKQFTVNSSDVDTIVDIVINVELSSITGYVYGEYGEPLEGVVVNAVSDSSEVFDSYRTDALGAYVLNGVPRNSIVYVAVSGAPVGVSGDTTNNRLLVSGSYHTLDLMLNYIETVNLSEGLPEGTPYSFWTKGEVPWQFNTQFSEANFKQEQEELQPLIEDTIDEHKGLNLGMIGGIAVLVVVVIGCIFMKRRK